MSAVPLKDKVVVIVGSTSGFGLSACRACIHSGARVVAVGYRPGELDLVRAEFGEAVFTVHGDAGEPSTAEEAVRKAVEIFGDFDGLYHVAGTSGRIWGDGPVHEIPDEGWEKTLHANLSSVFYSNRAALRAFLKKGKGGVIVNMASVVALSPSPSHFATHAYASAKSAIIGLTLASAAYYASRDIRINAVAPGLTGTPMASRASADPEIVAFIRTKQPLGGGRMGEPGDLDGTVVYLLSDSSRFMTGQVLAVDGGWSVSEGQWKTCRDSG